MSSDENELELLLERFKEILQEHGENGFISANAYDRLKTENKPGRTSLLRRTGFTWNELLGHCDVGAVQKGTRLYSKEKPQINARYTQDSGVVDFVWQSNKSSLTLDDAIKLAKVDLKKWKVANWKWGAFSVTVKIKQKDGTEKPIKTYNHTVRLALEPRLPDPNVEAIKDLIKEIPKFKFDRVPRFETSESGVAGELALVDAHFGKMAWAMETGRRNYDLNVASDDYMYAAENCLSFMAMYKPEKIFVIVGNDLMHVDNLDNVTPRGKNQLDVNTRLPKIYKTAYKVQLKVVYMARDIAPVEVLWIPGNHDPNASMYLCHTLEEHFRNDKHVTVDWYVENEQATRRKARLWGNLLVGWTHEIVGRHASWVNELAQQWPDLWGKSKWREWHHGHRHKKNEIKMYPIFTSGGVVLRQLTALSPIDAWHYDYLWTDALPGGECFIWTKDTGITDNHIAWTDTGLFKGTKGKG